VGVGVLVVIRLLALTLFVILDTFAGFIVPLLVLRAPAEVSHQNKKEGENNPANDFARQFFGALSRVVRIFIFRINDAVAVAINDIRSDWLNAAALACRYLNSKPDLRLLILCVKGRVEVVVERVSKNPVVHFVEVLANNGEVAICNVFRRNFLKEDVVSGLEIELGLLVFIAEIECQIWKLIHDVATVSLEVAPVKCGAGQVVVFVELKTLDDGLEFLEIVIRSCDEREARVHQRLSGMSEDVAVLEVNFRHLDLPGVFCNSVKPDHWVALPQVIVDTSESDLGGVVSRVTHLRIHAEYFFVDETVLLKLGEEVEVVGAINALAETQAQVAVTIGRIERCSLLDA